MKNNVSGDNNKDDEDSVNIISTSASTDKTKKMFCSVGSLGNPGRTDWFKTRKLLNPKFFARDMPHNNDDEVDEEIDCDDFDGKGLLIDSR